MYVEPDYIYLRELSRTRRALDTLVSQKEIHQNLTTFFKIYLGLVYNLHERVCYSQFALRCEWLVFCPCMCISYVPKTWLSIVIACICAALGISLLLSLLWVWVWLWVLIGKLIFAFVRFTCQKEMIIREIGNGRLT